MISLTEFQIKTLRKVADYGSAGARGDVFTPSERKAIDGWRYPHENGLIEILTPKHERPGLGINDLWFRITPNGLGVLGLDPKPRVPVSSHRYINQNAVAALQRMNKPPFWRPVHGIDFTPRELHALQGLCRQPADVRLVKWVHCKGGQECLRSEMDEEPKAMKYWLTDDGKLFVEGKMQIEIRLRTTDVPLVYAKRPPSAETIEKIKAAMRGDASAWENET